MSYQTNERRREDKLFRRKHNQAKGREDPKGRMIQNDKRISPRMPIPKGGRIRKKEW